MTSYIVALGPGSTGVPGVDLASPPAPVQGASQSAAQGDFAQALSAAAPVAARAEVRVVPAVATPGGTLGQEVLASLERFSGRVRALQDMGAAALKDLKHHRPGGPAGAAGMGTIGPPPGPAERRVDTAAPAAPVERLADVFRDSMAQQAKLYGLVTEISLGRSIAGSVNTTMKTLLTQSG